MEPAWHVYITRIGEKPASVAVDTKAADCDKNEFRHLLILRLRALEFRESGFPTRSDFDAIYSLEDQIEKAIPASDCRFVGRITVDGIYFLHFYSNQPKLHEAGIRELATTLKERQPSVQTLEEPTWDTYHSALYPTPDDWQQIKDGQVLDSLRKHGDDLSKPRQVDHWLYFDNEEACGGVAKRLVSEGFNIVDQRGPDEKNKQWTLQVCRCDSVQSQDITRLTVSLLHLANEFGGDYDGWETSVEK